MDEKVLFNKQYKFKGRHAVRVDQLSGVFDPKSKARIFDRNVDIYSNAPLIGFLYRRRAELDSTKNPETGQIYNQNIMGDRVIYSQAELTFNFSMIMLLDEEYEPDLEKRINKALRNIGDDPDDEKRFDSYVRGGVDVLYEKIIENASSPEQYINNLYDFIEDFYSKFNTELDSNEILEMCSH